jgi:putative endonuclease
MTYAVYIVECADRTLYTGIATDVTRRLAEHNGSGTRGARYTSARRPVRLIYVADFADRSTACKEEARIKRMSRMEKQALIAAGVPTVTSGSVTELVTVSDVTD